MADLQWKATYRPTAFSLSLCKAVSRQCQTQPTLNVAQFEKNLQPFLTALRNSVSRQIGVKIENEDSSIPGWHVVQHTVEEAGTKPCNKTGCVMCPHVHCEGLHFPNFTYVCNDQYTCITKCVIYAIFCKHDRCKTKRIAYIGQTTKPIKKRFWEHLKEVRGNARNGSLVTRHFNSPDHTLQDISVAVLCATDIHLLKELECRYIKDLGTLWEDGLNAELRWPRETRTLAF